MAAGKGIMAHRFLYDAETALVKTTGGTVRGYEWDDLVIFKGIPYAKAQRFHRPEKVSWEGTLDCTSYGYVCPLLTADPPQGELLVPHRYWPMHENCQNLNIWTPGTGEKNLPVMVWLHGGGYFAGSAIEHEAYDGAAMAENGHCVVVSINHRLNILGYLDLSDFGEEYENSGNAGTDDIIASLHWIQDNIASFGGDPGNVTLFGQSGGAQRSCRPRRRTACSRRESSCPASSAPSLRIRTEAERSLSRHFLQSFISQLSKTWRQFVKDLETVPYADLAAAYNSIKPEFEKKGAYTGCAPHRNRFYLGDPVQNGFRKETLSVPLVVGSVFGEFTSFLPIPKYPTGLSGEEEKKAVAAVLGEEGAASRSLRRPTRSAGSRTFWSSTSSSAPRSSSISGSAQRMAAGSGRIFSTRMRRSTAGRRPGTASTSPISSTTSTLYPTHSRIMRSMRGSRTRSLRAQ